ncbi:MAG: calycin-like domain-containing protein [Prevotella sp.]|nr:calycin-like domain-containing protein [Prevotella sp.]
MKIKSFITMAMVATTFAFGLCACSSDDDEPEAAVAEQVAGSYTGDEVMEVMGDGDTNTATYVFTKATDVTVDMTIPATAEGAMALPALPVKGIVLVKGDNTITGTVASYAGTVMNASGAEKSYTVSNLTALFSDKTVVVTYTLKYGNMPFDFVGKFTGTKQ